VEPNDDAFLFYQAADGQRLYLDALSFRMLVHCFGSPALCPQKVTAPVIAAEHFTQNEDTRRRFRFLSHLPLRSVFTFAQLDLSQVVSAATMRHFAAELKSVKMRLVREQRQALEQEKRLQKGREERELMIEKAKQQSRFASSLPHSFFDDKHVEPIHEGNPLGFAVPLPLDEAPAPQVSGWSAIADRGFASSQQWASLPERGVSGPADDVTNKGSVALPASSWVRPLSSPAPVRSPENPPVVPATPPPVVNAEVSLRPGKRKTKGVALFSSSAGGRSYGSR
jgi:hypothetical protein